MDPHQRYLHAKVKYLYEPKQVMPKGEYLSRSLIYPVELEIKDTTDADHHASYLDLLLKYANLHRLQVKLYDRRDDFNFDIANSSFLCSNIPQSPAYGVFVSQLIRYARASSMYEDFIMRINLCLLSY